MPHIPSSPTGPAELRAREQLMFSILSACQAGDLGRLYVVRHRTRTVRANAAILPSPVPTFVPVDAGKCFVLICGYTGKEVVR